MHSPSKKQYILPYTISYVSSRYWQEVIVPKGYKSDGASGAFDIWSEAWWVHDKLCDQGHWDDAYKTPITNWQASAVLSDILASEGRWARAIYWRWATFLFGCKIARKNGMFRLKKHLRDGAWL